MPARDIGSPAPSTKEPPAPFGNLDQPCPDWMRANGFGHWMTIGTRLRASAQELRWRPQETFVRRGCREAACRPDGLEWRLMAKQAETKRKSSLSYRPPKHLEDEFERRVASSGLSLNAFLTEAWHGRNRHRPAETKLLAHILAEEQAQSDALKAFEPAAQRDPEIKALLDELRLGQIEIRAALLSLMGRRP